MKKILKKKCTHQYKVTDRSNAIQVDQMGYPLQLCVCECEKCGKIEQQWIDAPTDILKDMAKNGYVRVKWDY